MYYDDNGTGKPTWKNLSIGDPPGVTCLSYPPHYDIPILVTRSGDLYALGLTCDDNPNGSFSRYDMEIGAWDELKQIPMITYIVSLVELNGYIYAIGEMNTDFPMKREVARYNIASNEWEEVSAKQVGITADDPSNLAVVFDGKIMVPHIKECFTGDSNVDLIVEMYDPTSNVWHVILKDKYPRDTRAVLTVQKNVSYLLMQPEYVYLTCLETGEICSPKVHKFNCDFDANPPKASLGEEVIQSVTLTNNSIGAFCINDDVFVNVWGCVYKLKTEGQKEVDVSRWSNIMKSTHLNTKTHFTFDKRLCT